MNKLTFVPVILITVVGCSLPKAVEKNENRSVPAEFITGLDSTMLTDSSWRQFFKDPNLLSLIDTALKNNQELNITLQEIEIARNDVNFREAPLQPTVGARLAGGIEKVGRYTSQGAGDATTEILPGKEMPDPLGDVTVGLFAQWEVDIWKKLHNAKKAAVTRYLSSVEGKNFVLTNLIAEVANSYFELLALDNQLIIVKQNIDLQKNALEIVKVQKEAARATELGVQKFQAEVLSTQSMEFEISQRIKETENRINFLLARFPQDIPRSQAAFVDMVPAVVNSGVPSQLLKNRPDIRKAELELAAAKLDVKVARAEFYPSLDITAGVGWQAFKPTYLFRTPESLLYNLAGDLIAPIVNRKAIKAEFSNANSRQLQAIYNYEQSILNAYLEVSTELSRIDNLGKSYALKTQQVDALTKSIEISNQLFSSARVDYFEVLMTQRDALDARLELVETKRNQMNAVVNVYKNLGGGWK